MPRRVQQLQQAHRQASAPPAGDQGEGLTTGLVIEARLDEVIDVAGADHRNVEAGHSRTLMTIFGEVRVERLAYRRRGSTNLHPADAVLNLPEEKHSHGLRRLAAIDLVPGDYEDAAARYRTCRRRGEPSAS